MKSCKQRAIVKLEYQSNNFDDIIQDHQEENEGGENNVAIDHFIDQIAN